MSLVLHTLNYLAVPLVVVGDSTSFLDGAVHWLRYHNLDGVSTARGPGMSMLLIPAMGLFGRSAWGLKLLLHLLAIGCVPLCYLLGWQLSGRRSFAYLASLVAVFTPDLYLYSNLVMSEIPNIFLGLAFLVLLVPALQTFEWGWLLAAMFLGAVNVLIRPENLLTLAVGMIFLAAKGIWNLSQPETHPGTSKTGGLLLRLGSAILVGILPLIWWSAHNYRQHGFFGISNYAGEVLYDGWIYFGESSHIPITDRDSPAARLISSIYVHHPRSADDTDAPTGWDIYPALLDAGYSTQQAFSILQQTAVDSIIRDPSLSLELLFIKLREGFAPETTATFTLPLPGEAFQPGELKMTYFDEEKLTAAWLVHLQRVGYRVMDFWYGQIYQLWIWVCLAALVLCLYRRPFFLWVPVVAVTSIRILFPTIMGISHWRYILSGILPLQIFGLAGFLVIISFFFEPIEQQKRD